MFSFPYVFYCALIPATLGRLPRSVRRAMHSSGRVNTWIILISDGVKPLATDLERSARYKER